MKFLKKIGIVILTLLTVVLIIALFINKDFNVMRATVISKPTSEVFEYIRYLENQDEYSKWFQMDPKMEQEITGAADGKVGAIRKWNSKLEDVGSGEQEITGIDKNKRIDYELRFIEPWEMNATAYFLTEEVADGSTKITWGFNGHTPWPWNFFNLFMDMDAMLGPDLQYGLDHIKKVLESPEE